MVKVSIVKLGKLLLLLVILSFPHSIIPIVVGSNTAVSRQGVATFPKADSDNEIRGFATMAGGFNLEDYTTSCIYNAFFPVLSNIKLYCSFTKM